MEGIIFQWSFVVLDAKSRLSIKLLEIIFVEFLIYQIDTLSTKMYHIWSLILIIDHTYKLKIKTGHFHANLRNN